MLAKARKKNDFLGFKTTFKRKIHADGCLIMRGKNTMHIALNDGGFASPNVTDHENLKEVRE